jgi:hypothetical protein
MSIMPASLSYCQKVHYDGSRVYVLHFAADSTPFSLSLLDRGELRSESSFIPFMQIQYL